MSFFYKRNESLEFKVNSYFSQLETYNREHFGGVLSVVLLGSLSRGEGTWIEQNGKTVLLSDIEFFTVYPKSFEAFDEFESYIQTAAVESFSDNSCSLFHVDNTFIAETELGSLEKKLLIFDAIHFGKCVVGKDVMCMFPKIDIDNINLYDIRDILTHRAFSVLYYGLPLKKQGNVEQYRYSLAKNSLDLMTVLLAKKGVLVSGFINKIDAIKKLDFSDDLKEYFSYCLSVKLGENYSKNYSAEEMEHYFVSIVGNAQRNFRISVRNTRKNLKSILKRRLGIVKRSLKYRHLVFGNHLARLIMSIEKNETISEREKMDNLVLNGYPVKDNTNE
jgi:hypothetical protein